MSSEDDRRESSKGASGATASSEDDRRESSTERAGGAKRRHASSETERSEVSTERSEAAPRDLLDSHPETAYFWGRVAGDGEVTERGVTVRTTDEVAADRLAAIAGAEGVDHRIVEREYAHDTSITRSEDSYTVQAHGVVGDRAAAAFGLPLDGGAGGYRFDALTDHDRQLLRGLLEGCGTVCFKSSAGTVGISFVADERKLLERIAGLLDAAAVEAPYGEIAETSSGGYWFGLEDAAAPAFGEWVYGGAESSGLFAPSRRRKLKKSLEQAGAQ